MSYWNRGGVDDSLLFFFLILVLLFCRPEIFGCGGEDLETADDTCC